MKIACIRHLESIKGGANPQPPFREDMEMKEKWLARLRDRVIEGAS